MRLWSIHPKYLDPAGLVALWREGLLAQQVLLGKTRGYRNHPQLVRFRTVPDPVLTIGAYLTEVLSQADSRGYKFDGSKIISRQNCPKILVQTGQIEYEWQHLVAKLKARSPEIYEQNKDLVNPDVHPLFSVVRGGIAEWERI